ncbi:hypothetical protein MBLNU459_g0176t1 [Dothideomycetes sp. NU459]
MSTIPASARRTFFAVLIVLLGGLFVAGRANVALVTKQIHGYVTGKGEMDLLTVIFETFYFSARVLVGGYGVYALLRDFATTTIRGSPAPPITKAAAPPQS